MKHSSLGLYLLVDGTHARPSDCEEDADGVLRHIYGMAVALDGEGQPMTVGGGAVDNKNVLAAELGDAAVAEAQSQAQRGTADVVPSAPAEQPVAATEEDQARDVAGLGVDREMRPQPKPARKRKPGYQTRKA